MGSKRVTTEQLIERFKGVHGNDYDYSEIKYVDMSSKIDIICPKHGLFHQVAKAHLVGSGCMKCYIEKKKISFLDVLEKFVQVHGDNYCYDNVDYINTSIKISITCLTHGDFLQKPSHHIMGRGVQNALYSRTENLLLKLFLIVRVFMESFMTILICLIRIVTLK